MQHGWLMNGRDDKVMIKRWLTQVGNCEFIHKSKREFQRVSDEIEDIKK